MNKEQFQSKIAELLPAYAPAALEPWDGHIREIALGVSGTVESNYDELYAGFLAVIRMYGRDTAAALFNLGEKFVMNSFELPGAAEMLSRGMPLDEVCERVTNGECLLTPEANELFKAALNEAQGETSPSATQMGMSLSR